MPTYQPGKFQVFESADLELMRLRIGEISTGIGAILGSVIGDPNGQERGWPGDIRFQIDNPSIWQKLFGEGDTFGWLELDAGSFAGAIAALQLQVAQLQTDLTALAAQVGANTAAIAALQIQVTNLATQVTALAAAVTTLQGEPYITWAATPSLANDRVATSTPTVVVTIGATTADFSVPANAITNTELADMPANTVKANPTAIAGDPQDLPVGTNTVVGRVAGNLVAAQVVADQIANDAVITAKIIDDAVTNAKLANMPATSVKVNPTALAGDPQDLAAVAPGYLAATDLGTIIWSPTIPGSVVTDVVVREVDFGQWAPTDFAAGGNIVYNLDGGSGVLPWTAASTENANAASATNGGFFRRDNADVGDDGGFGLRVFHDPSFNSSLLALTAPRLSIPLPTLDPNYDETASYRLEVLVTRIAISSAGIAPNTGRVFAVLFGAANTPVASGVRTVGGMIYYNGGPNTNTLQGISPTLTGVITAFSYGGGYNVMAMQWGSHQIVTTYAGQYVADWPSVPATPLRTTGAQVYINQQAAINNAPITSREVVFTLGTATGASATGSIDYMFRRMRLIRRAGS